MTGGSERKPCSVPGCTKPRVGRQSICSMHRKRLTVYGEFEPALRRPRGTARERAEPKINRNGPVPEYRPDLGPCWIWTACLHPKTGYGLIGRGGAISRGGAMVTAHSVVYEADVGPVPVGLELDHLCFVKACCNPKHLEPVTRSENVRRWWAYRRWQTQRG